MSPQVRREALPALQVLWKGDHLSVQQVFEKLGTIEDEREADELTAVLLSLRPDMKEALAAALSSGNPTLRYHAARGLAVSVSPQESFLLYHFLFSGYPETETETVKNILKQRRIDIPSQEQAAAILFERGTDYFERRRPLRADADGKITVWNWTWYRSKPGEPIYYGSDRDNVQTSTFDDIEIAYQYLADRYYRQSVECIPLTSVNYKAYRLAFVIARLEFLGHRGIQIQDLSPYGLLEIVRDTDVERLLYTSLEKKCFYAAQAAMLAIRRMKDTDLSLPISAPVYSYSLKSTNDQLRPLVQAVVSPNRNVRFVALETIMSIESAKPFAGSSLVADTLVWFSKSEGEKTMLSGHPQMATAMQTANLFLGLGYKTDVATTCRELFEKAAATPDVEVVFVDVRTTQPPVGEFVQMMQKDARTANIPIAVLGEDSRRQTADGNRGATAPLAGSLTYPRLANEEAAHWVLNHLLSSAVCRLPSDTRLEQAKQALVWLREIKLAELESGAKVYHFENFDSVVLDALNSERRVKEGLVLASVVKSAQIQSILNEMATNAVYPMWLREEASEALEESIERFGRLRRVRN